MSSHDQALLALLPPVTLADCRLSFPLTAATSVHIANALVATSALGADGSALNQAAESLARALRDDLSFSIWALGQRCRGNLAPAADPRELGEELAPRLVASFAESLSTFAVPIRTDDVRRLMAAAAKSPPAPGGKWLERLRSWPNWFATCGDAEGRAAAVFRDWLAKNPATLSLADAKPAGASGRVDKLSAGDERLAAVVNLHQLASAIEAARALRRDFDSRLQAAKLASLKEFAYGAGHEINNPLANISARAQTLLQGETDPERRRRLAAINSQAFRAHEMIADLMLYARPPQPKPAPTEVYAVIDAAIASLQVQADSQRTKLEKLAGSAALTVVADATQLKVALRALIQNALEALGDGGQIDIEARPFNGDHIELIVRDTGPGISPDARPHLFDPFFSGREAGRGLGFGLPKVWQIAQAHGGQIVCDDAPPPGATFRLRLPSAGPPKCLGTTTSAAAPPDRDAAGR